MEFVNLSQRIAVSFLKYQEVTGKNISLDKRGTYNNLEDVAIDCIATLFTRDEKAQFIQLKKYFANFVNDIDPITDNDILIKLRGLIIKKTKQELSRIFRERDPEGAKILRNVRVALKSAPDLGSFREMGREFLFSEISATSADADPDRILTKQEITPRGEENPGKSRDELYPNFRRRQPAIPERVLRQEYLNHYSPKDPVSIQVRKMLWIVGRNSEYQNFVGLDVVVDIIRTMNQEMFHESIITEVESESPLDRLRNKEIEKVVYSSINFITQKIEKQYVEKNKIAQEKAKIYLNTIIDLIQDLANGRTTDSNFSYLIRYLPEMTQKQYREEERSIFEYLVKLAKNDLVKKLQALL
jgi:hypothetical protein